MATINQLVRKPRAKQVVKSNVPALEAVSYTHLTLPTNREV